MPNTAQIADILFKKMLGLGTTQSGRAFYNEPIVAKPFTTTSQIWLQSDLIPLDAPRSAGLPVSSGIVQRVNNYPLVAVAGTTNSFSGLLLKDAIPFNWPTGTGYGYDIRDGGGSIINLGVGDWVVDTEAGILMFNDLATQPASMPPTISFFRYSGLKGVNDGSGVRVTGDQVISGTKNFSGTLQYSGVQVATLQDIANAQGGGILYFHNEAMDVAGYEKLSPETPNSGQDADTVSITNSSGTVLLGSYITQSGFPGTTSIPQGTWGFRLFGRADLTAGGNSYLSISMLTRTTGGTETLLFNVTGQPLTNTTGTNVLNYTYTGKVVADTDRLVAKVYASTQRASATVINFSYEGSQYTSQLSTPFNYGSSYYNSLYAPVNHSHSGYITTGAADTRYLTSTGILSGITVVSTNNSAERLKISTKTSPIRISMDETCPTGLLIANYPTNDILALSAGGNFPSLALHYSGISSLNDLLIGTVNSPGTEGRMGLGCTSEEMPFYQHAVYLAICGISHPRASQARLYCNGTGTSELNIGADTSIPMSFETAGSRRIMITRDGRIGLGNLTINENSILAKLHVDANWGAAGYVPIKLDAGSTVATPEPGAIEYDGTNFYFTLNDNTRYPFQTGSSVTDDGTFLRTTGDQSVAGTKNFTGILQYSGNVVTTGGPYSPTSHTHNYLTTGAASGLFLPISGSGVYALKSDTGSFLTTVAGDTRYSGMFLPISGSGTYALKSDTGSFLTSATANPLYLPISGSGAYLTITGGSQVILGTKNFSGQTLLSGSQVLNVSLGNSAYLPISGSGAYVLKSDTGSFLTTVTANPLYLPISGSGAYLTVTGGSQVVLGTKDFSGQSLLSGSQIVNLNIGANQYLPITGSGIYSQVGHSHGQYVTGTTINVTGRQISGIVTFSGINVSVTSSGQTITFSGQTGGGSFVDDGTFVRTTGNQNILGDKNFFGHSFMGVSAGNALKIGPATGTGIVGVSQPNFLEVFDTGNTQVVNVAHFNAFRDNVRPTFTLSNSNNGAWENAFLAFMVHGTGFTNDYYLDDGTDARTALILAQGGYLDKLSIGTYGDQALSFFTNSVSASIAAQRLYIRGDGAIGIGLTGSQIGGHLHIKAGGTLDTESPLRFTSGELNSNPQPGAIEYNGTNFYMTLGNSVRYVISTGTGVGGIVDDGTFVRTTGTQNIAGTKNFTGSLQYSGNVVTTGGPYSLTSHTHTYLTTGAASGLFLPISGSGTYALKSDTGNFITTTVGDVRYSGMFLPISGSGTYALKSDTGSFLTTVTANPLYLPISGSGVYMVITGGNQVISGVKNFSGQTLLSGNQIINLSLGNSLYLPISGSGVYALRSESGQFITTGAGDARYLPISGSGVYALKSDTGSFLTTVTANPLYLPISGSGAYMVVTGGSQVISGTKNFSGQTLLSGSQILNVNLGNAAYLPISGSGVYALRSESGSFITTGAGDLRYSGMFLPISGSGTYALKSDTGSFLTAATANPLYLPISGSGAYLVITGGNQVISGTKNFSGQTLLSGNQIVNLGIGDSRYLPISGSGTYALKSDTGSFLTTSVGDVRYSGMFLPISGSGVYVLKSDTGSFLTTVTANPLYLPITGSGAYLTVTGGNQVVSGNKDFSGTLLVSGKIVTTGGPYYPLNSNPSGYLTTVSATPTGVTGITVTGRSLTGAITFVGQGSINLTTNGQTITFYGETGTGNFVDDGTFVRTTGLQTIVSEKVFYGPPTVGNTTGSRIMVTSSSTGDWPDGSAVKGLISVFEDGTGNVYSFIGCTKHPSGSSRIVATHANDSNNALNKSASLVVYGTTYSPSWKSNHAFLEADNLLGLYLKTSQTAYPVRIVCGDTSSAEVFNAGYENTGPNSYGCAGIGIGNDTPYRAVLEIGRSTEYNSYASYGVQMRLRSGKFISNTYAGGGAIQYDGRQFYVTNGLGDQKPIGPFEPMFITGDQTVFGDKMFESIGFNNYPQYLRISGTSSGIRIQSQKDELDTDIMVVDDSNVYIGKPYLLMHRFEDGAQIGQSKGLCFDADGRIKPLDATTVELNYVDGVTGAIQTQFNNIYSNNMPSIGGEKNFTLRLKVSGTIVTTGGPYSSSSHTHLGVYMPITGSGVYVKKNETGEFLTTGAADNRYIQGVTADFVVTGDTSQTITGTKNFVGLLQWSGQQLLTGSTSSFALAANTGSFLTNSVASGLFLSITGSGVYALRSESGSFLTTGAADARYIQGATADFVVTGNTSQTITGTKNFVGLLQWSGQQLLTGSTSSFALAANTGSFLSTGAGDNRYVIITGKAQNVLGTKRFIGLESSGISLTAYNSTQPRMLISGNTSPTRMYIPDEDTLPPESLTGMIIANTTDQKCLGGTATLTDLLIVHSGSVGSKGLLINSLHPDNAAGLVVSHSNGGLGWDNQYFYVDVYGKTYGTAALTGAVKIGVEGDGIRDFIISAGGIAPMKFNTQLTTRMQINNDGRIGIGLTDGNTTARLHLPAGETAYPQWGAPLKFTPNTDNNLFSEPGVIQFINKGFYITDSNNGVGAISTGQNRSQYQSVVPSAGTLNINFSGLANQQFDLNSAGPYSITGSNWPAVGHVADVLVYIENTYGSSVNLTFPGTWKNIGTGWQPTLLANKSALLWLRAIDNTGKVIGTINSQV